jgi:hypothetical protein
MTMANKLFLGETQIAELVKICKKYISKNYKNTYENFENRYGKQFTNDVQTNKNIVWQVAINELKTTQTLYPLDKNRPSDSFAFAHFVDRIFDNVRIGEIVRDYIAENHAAAWELATNVEPYKLLDEVHSVLKANKIQARISFAELIGCKDFNNFFNERFGVVFMDKKTLETSQNVAKFFDTMFGSCTNKSNVFDAVGQYLKTGNLADLNNTLNFTEQ